MNVIRSVSDKIIVLKDGKMVEKNTSDKIFNNPKSNYTKNLISSLLWS